MMRAIREMAWKRRGLAGFGVGILTAAVLAGGAVALAAIPSSSTGYFTACVNKTSGAVRIIDYQAGKRCTSSESTVNWSKGYQYRGAWSSVGSYAVLDVVTSRGSSYLARGASVGKLPSANPTYWGLLAAAGAQGPAGAAGAQGSAGAAGAQGPAGASGVTPSHFQIYAGVTFSNSTTDVLVGFLTLSAGTWNIRIHAMPYNSGQELPTPDTPPFAAPAGSQYLPAVSCSLIEPDAVTRHTEYTSVPFAPDQNSQPGTTGTAQMEIDTQLANTNGATYTIKCSMPSANASTDSLVGVSDVSATADEVSPV